MSAAPASCTNDNIALALEAARQADRLRFPGRGRADRARRLRLLKASTRPHAAALFHEWWMGKEGQDLLVKGGKYSSRTDIAPPTGSPPLDQAQAADPRLQRVQGERARHPARSMTDIFGGEWGN